jgi:hypothetical protein
MKLNLVRVKGFKRFGTAETLLAPGPVVAVVGPNEAGKTSLLEAMKFLSRDGGLEPHEPTDRSPRSDDDWVVSAHFTLDDGDREVLGDLVAADATLTYKVFKFPNGEWDWDLEPRMPRDLTWRKRAVKTLRDIAQRDWLKEVENPVEGPSFLHRAASLAEELDTEKAWIPDGVRDRLIDLASEVKASLSEDSRKALWKFVDLLERTQEAEDETPLGEQIHDVLWDRRPKFLLFQGAELELATEYRWADHAVPPPALANLFVLAGVDYQSMRHASTTDDRATRDLLVERADKQLNEAFKAWRQGDVHVTFSPDVDSLQLLVKDRATSKRTRLDDRSSGLRRFVALVAFTARFGGDAAVRPVLLIDEAETHLHYGAQADLVRVFERQEAAETVIYTTHSIGCLPADLGASVRVVSPDDDEHSRSVIRNSVWAAEGRKVGMTPTMLAMGANALAFTPSRRAVIGEGPTEAILLPALIREALPAEEQDEPLGYQVAPGVSEVDADDAEDLELEAGAVAFLVDDDEGGKKHAKKLPRRAREEGRILTLGAGKHPGLCTEDFVDAEVLVKAVNGSLDDNRKSKDVRLSVSKLPAVRRGAFIEKWGLKHHGFRPNKVAIALHALEVGRERGQLLQRTRKQTLLAQHRKLQSVTALKDDSQADE